MNVDTYRGVLKARGLEADKPVHPKDKLTRAQRCFRKDLIRNRVTWTGQFCYDYRIYIKNHHPLCLCWATPKLHPVHGCLGFQLFLVELSLNVPLVGIENAISKNANAAEDFIIEIFAIIIGALVLSLASRMLVNIGICPCLQGSSRNPCCRCLGTTIGYIFMTLITFCFVIGAFVLFGVVSKGQGNFGRIYVAALALDWFVIWPCLAMFDYWRHRKKEKKGKKHFSVTLDDYIAYKAGKPIPLRAGSVDPDVEKDENNIENKTADLVVNNMNQTIELGQQSTNVEDTGTKVNNGNDNNTDVVYEK
eukprot:62668_1